MLTRRIGLKLLVICATTAGLATFGSGIGQAEEGAFWLVQGLKISEELKPPLRATTWTKYVKFLGLIGSKIKFDIVCDEGFESEVILSSQTRLLGPNGGMSVTFKKLTGCTFRRLVGETEKEEKLCEPHIGAEKGVISIVPLKGLITLNSEGAGILSLEPTEGTTLTSIELSEECAFGEKISFSGKLALKDAEGKFSTDQLRHLLEEEPSATKLVVNGKEANTADIDFQLLFSLASGPHLAMLWAGHPA
jgi:hypothetical protein